MGEKNKCGFCFRRTLTTEETNEIIIIVLHMMCYCCAHILTVIIYDSMFYKVFISQHAQRSVENCALCPFLETHISHLPIINSHGNQNQLEIYLTYLGTLVFSINLINILRNYFFMEQSQYVPTCCWVIVDSASKTKILLENKILCIISMKDITYLHKFIISETGTFREQ
jgi:hypothetical protein